MLSWTVCDSSYHHDVVLQPPASYDQLQVRHGAEPVSQRGAAVVHHVLHREVVGGGPALVVLVPVDARAALAGR